MIHDVHAIYDHGIFRPIEPLSLPDGARVRLRVEEENDARVEVPNIRADAETLEYDDSDWAPEEMSAVIERWLDDPQGWGAPGMEIYDELYGNKSADNDESA